MDSANYADFSRRLLAAAAADCKVIGLVALGSMARQDYEPDRFSDHDFFLVTVPGVQQSFRDDLAWLPDASAIALAFQETAHGLKVLYRSGHLLEFAVFDLDELRLARVNRYLVLLDRADVAARLADLAARTTATARAEAPGDRVLFGQFLCHLAIGAGRYARGERASGRHVVFAYAQQELLQLIARRVAAQESHLLDNLDPWRRFERVYPELGDRLSRAAALPAPAAARLLLGIAEDTLLPQLHDLDAPAMALALAATRRAVDQSTDRTSDQAAD